MVMTRAVLVAEIMQRDGDQPVGHHEIGLSTIAAASAKAIGEVERLAEFSVVELVDAQPPERAQQEILVAELLGQLQGRLQAGPASRARPTPYISDQPRAADSCMRMRAASPVSPSAASAVRCARDIRRAATAAPRA